MSSARMPFALARASTELALSRYDRAIETAAVVRRAVEESASRAYLKRYESMAALTEGKALAALKRAPEALPLLERAVALGSEIYDQETSVALADARAALGGVRKSLAQ